MDIGSVFTAIRNFDPEAGCDNGTFQPCSEYVSSFYHLLKCLSRLTLLLKALSNLKKVVDSMRGSYIINQNRSQTAAIAVGRFTQDTYLGGNVSNAGVPMIYTPIQLPFC